MKPSRFFFIFLAVVTVGIVVFVTIYLGAGFSKLTFDPERRKMPLVIVKLERFGPSHTDESYAEANDSREDLFFNYDYDIIFEGASLLSSDGNDAEHWDRVLVETFAVTGDYVNAVTDPAYATLEDMFDESSHAEFGRYVGHVELKESFKEPIVLLFSDAPMDRQRQLVDTVTATLKSFNGRIHFGVPMEKIDGNSDREVHYFALIEFDDPGQMISWLANTIRKSQFAHLRKYISNISLVVATPS